MSTGFDGLDATEKAGIGAALNRCRALAAKIAIELRNKRAEHFVDKLSRILLPRHCHCGCSAIASVASA